MLLTDPNYVSVGPTEMLRKTTQLKADALKGNSKANPALAKELEEHGYDQDALNALAFLKGVPSLEVIEKFIAAAHQRLMSTLREVAVRREFVARARLIERRIAIERRLDANTQASATPAKLDAAKK
jgi:hypothetical protein